MEVKMLGMGSLHCAPTMSTQRIMTTPPTGQTRYPSHSVGIFDSSCFLAHFLPISSKYADVTNAVVISDSGIVTNNLSVTKRHPFNVTTRSLTLISPAGYQSIN